MNQNVIEFINVKKYFWLFDKDYKKLIWLFKKKGHTGVKKAVDNVSFTVKHGETLGIIGKNGSGKSTILKLIASITHPSDGSIKIDGKVAALINLSAGFIADFTGRQNLYYKGKLIGMDKKDMDDIIDEIIAFADIGEYIDMPIKTYSTGMRGRLGFALAAFSDPDILLVDEVFSVGDKDFKRKSAKRTKELLGSNKTVIVVSHSDNIIRDFCDRAIYIKNGKLICDGDVDTVLEAYNKNS